MTYRQNSKTHALSEPEYFTSKILNIQGQHEILKCLGSVSETPSEQGKAAHSNARARSWQCVCLFALISWAEGKVARYTTRCVFTCGRLRLKQRLTNSGGLCFIPVWVHLILTLLVLYLMEHFYALVYRSYILFPFCDRDTGTWLLLLRYLSRPFYFGYLCLENSDRLESSHVQVARQTTSAFHWNRNYEMYFSMLGKLCFCARGCFFFMC